MFDALLISLIDGQSYKNVRILNDADIEASAFPKVFEEYTGVFYTEDGRTVICHNWNIKVIHLDKEQRGKKDGIPVERILLVGDTLYNPAVILPQVLWESRGIPYYFIKHTGISGQFVFSTLEGTFLAEDMNVVSIIYPAAPRRPIIISTNIKQAATTVRKWSSVPDTVQGKIRHA